MIVVTGGSGFIGKNFILEWFRNSEEPLINIDKLTYAASENVLTGAKFGSKYRFVKEDIANSDVLSEIFGSATPRGIINFAAETHVDRSIASPENFVSTNILGTSKLLETVRKYQCNLNAKSKEEFKYIHISTDEVYGSLRAGDPAFVESSKFEPNSPYAASKASSDHLVHAYSKTYDVNTITVNCSNNYGPFQFPEKLIPLSILNALRGEPLRIYGDGKQIRDWLHVHDHCSAIRALLNHGSVGTAYNVGGDNEKQNIDVVNKICALLDQKKPRSDGAPYSNLIKFVEDRPGHDFRYAVDSTKILRDVGWQSAETFDSGLEKTVEWYLNNEAWLETVSSGSLNVWLKQQYGS